MGPNFVYHSTPNSAAILCRQISTDLRSRQQWNKQVEKVRDGMRKTHKGDGRGIVVGAGRLDNSIHDGNQKGGSAATDADSKPEP